MPNQTERADLQVERTRCVKSQFNCDASPISTLHKVNRKVASNFVTKERSLDSESQEEEHNFSDLLNLSVCAPSTANALPAGVSGIPHLQELQQSFSVANSMTSSDISSLANLGELCSNEQCQYMKDLF